MTFRRSFVIHPTAIAAGALLGLAVASPALAANFALPFDLNALGWRDFLLYGSIALLVVALTLKVIRDKRDAAPTPQAPDLRWWKNQDQHT